MPIYLDHNATSPASAEHLAAVFSRLQSAAANPSSPHAAGRTASVALANARKQIAASVEVEPGEVIFVSGGSEANNLATAGVLHGLGKDLAQLHAITTAIEH
ncbi:aminotransferase class V-fold PLP-dependent enzyme, partial [bacterium]|nr:aminotransferase class V-fold PLP-dependent enzyme [bacterium]